MVQNTGVRCAARRPFTGALQHVPCVSDVYIEIPNSSELHLWYSNEKNLRVGVTSTRGMDCTDGHGVWKGEDHSPRWRRVVRHHHHTLLNWGKAHEACGEQKTGPRDALSSLLFTRSRRAKHWCAQLNPARRGSAVITQVFSKANWKSSLPLKILLRAYNKQDKHCPSSCLSQGSKDIVGAQGLDPGWRLSS